MKITLIEPAMIKTDGFAEKPSWLIEPLTLATLAGLTPSGIQVQALDDRIEEIDYDEARDLVGISVKTFTARRAYQIAGEFRRRGVPVILGGFHPTLAPQEAMQWADSILIGEAEGIWGEILVDAAQGRLKRVYRQSAHMPLENVTPDRSVFGDKKYLPVNVVETSRGCRFACGFCAVCAFFDRTLRHRPVDEVVNEVAGLDRKPILFADDNIVADHGAAKNLCEALIPLRLRWIGEASLTMTRDPELMRLMRDSGCVGLLVGIESLSEIGLEQFNKSWNRAACGYERALQVLRDHGIAVLGSFILGTDDDTPDSLKRIAEFAIRQKIFAALFNMLILYPGTTLYEEFRSKGRLLKPCWWLDPSYTHGSAVFSPKRMSPDELEQGWLMVHREFYGVRSILERLLEPQANAKDPWRILTYLSLNLSAYREEMRRYTKHLGKS